MTTTVSGSQITFNDNTTQNTSAYGGGFAFRNRIINGGMVIDQRNAGASVTPTVDNTYTLDRWTLRITQASKLSVQQNAASVTPPVGFTNYLGATSLSSYSIVSSDYFNIRQLIEGFNVADLGWGTANAKTITLSFWVRSSLTGTFGGCVNNSAFDRSYPFTYTISSANTWEQKTVTIPGDTSGTWLTTNGVGISISFGLGIGSTYTGTAGAWAGATYLGATGATSVVGTNGATFYITGVQLEKGSTATSFDYRPYGQELALCQRYYEKSYNIDTAPGTNTTTGQTTSNGMQGVTTTTSIQHNVVFKVTKRASTTISLWDGNGNAGKCNRLNIGVADNYNSAATASSTETNSFLVASSGTATATSITFQWAASAEL